MLQLPPKHKFFALLIILTVFLAGCNAAIPGLSPTSTSAPSPTPTPTCTPSPTPTVTPLPPVGVLLAPPGVESELVEEMQARVSEWIPALGYRFQVRPSLTTNDLDRDDFKLIVMHS